MSGWGQQRHVDHTLIWKIEHRGASLTLPVAKACDDAMGAGGALVAAWHSAQDTFRPARLPIARSHLTGRDTEVAVLNHAVSTPPDKSPAVLAIDRSSWRRSERCPSGLPGRACFAVQIDACG
jgi:hypothetical protein